MSSDSSSHPKILCSTEDSIGVGYYIDVGAFQKDDDIQRNETLHREAQDAISERCAGEYIEARRVNQNGQQPMNSQHGYFKLF
jgi:hypothetical protein